MITNEQILGKSKQIDRVSKEIQILQDHPYFAEYQKIMKIIEYGQMTDTLIKNRMDFVRKGQIEVKTMIEQQRRAMALAQQRQAQEQYQDSTFEEEFGNSVAAETEPELEPEPVAPPRPQPRPVAQRQQVNVQPRTIEPKPQPQQVKKTEEMDAFQDAKKELGLDDELDIEGLPEIEDDE